MNKITRWCHGHHNQNYNLMNYKINPMNFNSKYKMIWEMIANKKGMIKIMRCKWDINYLINLSIIKIKCKYKTIEYIQRINYKI